MLGLSITVGAAAVMVAPPRNLRSAPTWAAGVYAQGALVKSTDRQLYWCVTAGTSVAAPYAGGGLTHSVDSMLWQNIPRGPRRMFNGVNTGATLLTVTSGIAPSAAGAGPVLQANSSVTFGPEVQDAIYAFGSAGGGTIGVQDI